MNPLWMLFFACSDQAPPGLRADRTLLRSEKGREVQGYVRPVPPAPPPLVARLDADDVSGDFPLVVELDASTSDLGSGTVRFEWTFGDGEDADGDASTVHTYVGEGEFEARVTLVDEVTGEESSADVEIEVDEPRCPHEEPVVAWGLVDPSLTAVSGLASSRREPDVYWVHEDNDDELVALDPDGNVLSEQDLPNSVDELEDLALAIDPETGASTLFLGDIGDNHLARNDIALYVAEEPDPFEDGDLDPLRIELTYPDGPHDAETLLVDPWTLDVYFVTKVSGGVDASVYVKRAPHDDEGPFELESLGDWPELDLTATAGDVSPDGSQIVIRDYSDTARLFFRDGYEPFEEAFDDEPCRIDIFQDLQGEGVGFTRDGEGLVTVGEGLAEALHYVEL